MTRPTAIVRAVAALLCTLLAVSGCQSGTAPPTGSTGEQTVASTALPRIPYVDLVDTIAAHRAKVWVEVDLVKAWQAGPQRYADVLNIAVKLASRPGVVGIKIADGPYISLSDTKWPDVAIRGRPPGGHCGIARHRYPK